MAKGALLSERDARRIQRVVRQVERDTLVNRPRRRHRDREEGSIVRLAYCKTGAGAATTIVCYLDTDLTGDEITVKVNTNPINTSLNDCAPFLLTGTPISVHKIDDDWYCTQTIDSAVESDIYEA